jgi:hypothetical protein
LKNYRNNYFSDDNCSDPVTIRSFFSFRILLKDIISDLKAVLGHFARINHHSSKFLVTKTGTAMLNSHLPAAQKSSPQALKKLEENYLFESFENWSKRVAIVNIVCDPVKRLLSDFQHYKAEHPNVLKFNAHKFGNHSEFSEMSFDRFVNSHIKNHKKETELGSASRKIFQKNF